MKQFLLVALSCLIINLYGNENVWNKFSSDSSLHQTCMSKNAPKECRLLEALITRKKLTLEEGGRLLKEDIEKCKDLSEKERKQCREKSEFAQMINIMNICEHVENIEKAYTILSNQPSQNELLSQLGKQTEADDAGLSSITYLLQEQIDAKETTHPMNVGKVLFFLSDKIEELTTDIVEKEYSNRNQVERERVIHESTIILRDAFLDASGNIWGH